MFNCFCLFFCKTINCLQKLSRLHKLAIVTSIHQPNSEVLMMFDQLYVLAKGGRCVFAGAPNALRTHLTECKIDCVDWQVPIEVLLKVSSNKSKKVLDELVGTTSKLISQLIMILISLKYCYDFYKRVLNAIILALLMKSFV